MGSCCPCLQMWRYEGHRTLMDYLKRRDCIRTLSEDLTVSEQAVVATVMRQLLEGISVSAAAWPLLYPAILHCHADAGRTVVTGARLCCLQCSVSECCICYAAAGLICIAAIRSWCIYQIALLSSSTATVAEAAGYLQCGPQVGATQQTLC